MKNQLILVIGLLAVGLPALADEEVNSRFKINIVAVDDDEPIRLAFSSDDVDFNPMDMQVGENRSFTDAEGRNILVTRDESGFKFDIDGKTVELPEFDGVGGTGDIDFDLDIDTDKRIVVERIGGGSDGITILSGDTIDDATRQQVESVLRSAGYDDAVNFVDDATAKEVKKVIRVEKTH